MAKILIIEDDKILADVYKMTFELAGHQASLAFDGLEGLGRLKTQIPDVILLDLMMPNMDGGEFLDEIKSKPETKYIPVLVLSSMARESDVKLALSKGAIKHIDKSRVQPKEVVKIVEGVLSAGARQESSEKE